MSSNASPSKNMRRRTKKGLSGTAKTFIAATSLSAFLGGWGLIASQYASADFFSPEPSSTPSPWPTPTMTQVPPPASPTPWPTISALSGLDPVPTVAPLSPERFHKLSQNAEQRNLDISVAPLPTLAPMPPPKAPPPAAPANNSTSSEQVSGQINLISPINGASNGPTVFEWQWNGNLPPNYGFEVLLWLNGEPVAGAHDALADNRNGRVISLGGGRYQLMLDVRQSAGVRGRSGTYWWTVAVVQTSPNYVNTGLAAQPAALWLDFGGGGGGNPGGGGGQVTKGS